MITYREASTISWSEMPGLTVTFLQEDGLFVISRSSVLSSLVLWVTTCSNPIARVINALPTQDMLLNHKRAQQLIFVVHS